MRRIVVTATALAILGHLPAVAAPAPQASTTSQGATRAKSKRAQAFDGPILPPEADFLGTDIEIRAHIAFNGINPGPFSLLTALAGWTEVGIGIDGGIATWRDFTVSAGLRAHFAAALLPQALTPRVSDYDDNKFRWSAWESGALARVAFHFTRLASVDPYVFGGFGAGAFHMDVSLREPKLLGPQRFTVPYLRGEIGAGLDIPVLPKLFIGIEARYLITGQLRHIERLRFGRDNDTWATFAFHPQHRPPKGFSWVVGFGYRF